MALLEPEAPIRVYIHLGHGQGGEQWEHRYNNGTLLGINEVKPYGYHRAADWNCHVEYSVDLKEGRFQNVVRRGLVMGLGFDFVHAWRNAKRVWNADIIWTHTESQTLGLLLLFSIFPWRKRPRLIGQCVWMPDLWNQYSFLRKWLYSWLLGKVDIQTVLSPENLKVCQTLFPESRIEMIRFGIKAEKLPEVPRTIHRPIRIVAVGNDRHRDWTTVIAAFGSCDDFELRIVSTAIRSKLPARMKNVAIEKLSMNSELMDLYKWADIAVIGLRPNLHASGITVIQEAVLNGIPVICSDTGGLRAYFGENEVRYVPVGGSAEMRDAALEIALNQDLRERMTQRARARMGEGGLSSQAYVRRHVELSRELLQRKFQG